MRTHAVAAIVAVILAQVSIDNFAASTKYFLKHFVCFSLRLPKIHRHKAVQFQ